MSAHAYSLDEATGLCRCGLRWVDHAPGRIERRYRIVDLLSDRHLSLLPRTVAQFEDTPAPQPRL